MREAAEAGTFGIVHVSLPQPKRPSMMLSRQLVVPILTLGLLFSVARLPTSESLSICQRDVDTVRRVLKLTLIGVL